MTTDITEILDQVEALPDTGLVGRQPVDLIDAAERRLGLVFPEDYRAFLLRFGAGSIGGEEINGVFTWAFEESSVPNAVWSTLDARVTWGIPLACVHVGEADGGEAQYLLDASEPSHPVRIWMPDHPLHDMPIKAPDFASHVSDLIARAGSD